MTTKKTAATTVKTTSKKAPAEKAAAPVKEAAKKSKKERKEKVVRDSFTMPQSEYRKIAEIKEICLEAGLSVKKSEVLRAGLKALSGMNAAQLKRALAGLEKIKTGRPKKN
ncbi:MAG TPA: hypothetical protein VFQ99_04785 [Gallionella sp.]|nr:hypothetical protein [Gallionella sp.]